ncbi:MAG TPA: hypothetical protein VI755_02355 [Anaerolineales bacterium]|nr:hypothetical protein [Anaerolineales bacterium]
MNIWHGRRIIPSRTWHISKTLRWNYERSFDGTLPSWPWKSKKSGCWYLGCMVERGGKRFKDRFTGSGMRWSWPGAERLLPVWAAIMSRHFDELWRTAYNSPPN